MKKIVFLLVLILSVAFNGSAAWLTNYPQTVVQPDGTVVHCFATGDEFYNWLHDADGFTIIRDKSDGFFKYAEIKDDILVPTTLIAGKDDPLASGLKPWTNIPVEKMQAIRAEIFRTQMPDPEPINGYDQPRSGRNEGTLNNLVVYIRFSDQTEYTEDTTTYTNMFNNAAPGYSSMYNYFKFASYDKMFIPSLFYPIPLEETVISYQDIYPRSYYVPYDPVTNPNGYMEGEAGEREHALLKRAVAYIESEVPDNLNIDYNNDGYVDNMVFIVKGETTAWATLLWPHRWVLYNEFVYINGKRVWDYNFQIQNHLLSSGNGVLCHEMNHSLGAPDLYHYNSTPVDAVGDWDVMCANHNPPQLMGAYMKFRYGKWIDAIPEITECGTYTLNPLAMENGNCYKIASPNSTTDYFIVEYRKKEGTFEGTLPASGLLIYKINTLEDGNGNAQGPPDEVYIYRPDGTLTINGNLDDAVFAGDYDRTSFNDNTNPACFLSNGQPGGIDISNIGMIGETISFDVNFEKEPLADFRASATLITEGCSIDFEDLSVCEVTSWQWTFEGGTPETFAGQNPIGITYENEGTYDVTLTVSNTWGSDTKVYQGMIDVSTSVLPVVNFTMSDSLICMGEIIQFSDLSEVCPTGWNWEITPGTGFVFLNGTNSASQNPQVGFIAASSYTVKLTVTNANGSSELTKNDIILVGGLDASEFTESFEGLTFTTLGWTIENPDNAITWQLYNVGGSGAGTRAAGINLYSYFSFGQRDRLISPPLNMTASGEYTLSFKHAYSQTNLQYSDSLIVKISTDCGDTWTRVLAVAEDGTGNFVTKEPVNYSFYPTEPEDWCGGGVGSDCYAIDLSSFAGHNNVKIMFESCKFIGNNLFIDDIKMDVFVGNHDPESTDKFLVISPNPNRGKFIASFAGLEMDGHIEIFNAQGQVVHRQDTGHKTYLDIDLGSVPQGIYFVRLSGYGISETKKVVVE